MNQHDKDHWLMDSRWKKPEDRTEEEKNRKEKDFALSMDDALVSQPEEVKENA